MAELLAFVGTIGAVMCYWQWRREARRRAQAEEQLQAALGRLAQLGEDKSSFLHALAHDFKNPIFSLLLSTEALKNGGVADEATAQLSAATILDAAFRMDRMVKNLVSFDAIEQCKPLAADLPVDAVAVLRDVVARYKQLVDSKGLSIHLDTPNTATFYGDASAFTEILENLLLNALRFCPEGKSVSASVQRATGKIHICVRDEGPGLSEAVIARLFDGQTGSASKHLVSKGAKGLGLVVTKHFTEAMNGKIWCESAVGKGAAFHLEFPEAK
jgi:signal transduction histidine kinase